MILLVQLIQLCVILSMDSVNASLVQRDFVVISAMKATTVLMPMVVRPATAPRQEANLRLSTNVMLRLVSVIVKQTLKAFSVIGVDQDISISRHPTLMAAQFVLVTQKVLWECRSNVKCNQAIVLVSVTSLVKTAISVRLGHIISVLVIQRDASSVTALLTELKIQSQEVGLP